jgi:8-oxo-dGTP pyrophosphatase MutT (NUDIX family)
MKSYHYFMIDGCPKPFGYIHSSAVPKVSWEENWSIDAKHRLVIFKGGDSFAQRCQRMEATLRANPNSDDASAFGRWCDELFPVYAANGEHVLDLDGAGVDTLGIVNYACHMITFVTMKDGLKYWVPRRAKTKLSYPNMLDNTVGGSLRSGEKPIDCIVRESAEEASLPAEYTRANIKPCGILSYQISQTDDGQPGCQHQVQYLYEMEVSEDVIPVPNDGEAQAFNLMSLEEVVAALRQGAFKLNCGMTWMAFLIRHGHVNAENEPRLVEIEARLHRKHDLFVV